VPASGTASSAKPAGWDELVQAAKREGALTVYGGTDEGLRRTVTDDFQKAFPGIKVDATLADSTTEMTRITSERTAGRYLADLLINGSTIGLTLKAAGAIAPLKPQLMLPDVLDESNWLQHRLWFEDAAEPYTTLSFQGLLITPFYVNPTIVKPSELTSYMDVLDPKWKGKMVSNDIRRSGPGGVPARFIYKQPSLGPSWFQRLYGDMNVTMSSDHRQMVDWLAQGRFAIGLFVSETEADIATDQGLPVAPVPLDQMKEGAAIGPGYGSIDLFDHAPHPNAAKLFINWFLSREGQTTLQRESQYPSLRVDVPKDGLRAAYVPKPDRQYADGGSEEYSKVTTTIFNDLITKALDQAGKTPS
ncbi:MAG TPA: extracellular solute-binding protein, partial [Chloroflexota bacterium]|nr:extracellular solute-binding protein [Chloroflexota bacterium]